MYIPGTEGPDILEGTNDGDLIVALGGNDLLNGRGGFDSLWGGDGEDRFEFFADQGSDAIGDFTHGEDHIAIADFVTPDNRFLLFEDLDTNSNGLLEDGDADVSYGRVDVHWVGLTVDLTPYAPGLTDSELNVYNVSSLDLSDFV